MTNWAQKATQYRGYKDKKRVEDSLKEENLLTRFGIGYDHAHKNDYGYTSLSKRWKDIYKRARDYYNNEAHKGFYDTYSGTRNKQGYVSDTGRWYSELEGLRDSANEGVDELLAELDQYSRYYNEDAVKYVRGLITERQNVYNDAMKDAGEFRDIMSQWKTEDDYNTYLWENDFAKAYEAGDYDTAEAMVRDELSRLSSMSPEEMGKQQERLLKLSQYGELVSAGREKALYQPYIEQYGNMSREELINARDALGLAYHNAVSGKPSGADPLGLGKIDTSEMERELKYVNYLINKDDPEVQAAWAAAEEEERKQKEIENAPWWQRTLSTAGDIINRGGYAITQGLETVNDGLGRAFVGAGDFVNDVLDDIGKSSGRRNYNFQWENWKEDYLKGLDYEWAKDTFNIDEDFNTVEDFSYLSEVPELQKTVHSVIDGVGQMAPAIALGLATGGAGAGAAYMSTLAGGSAIDEALKEGADLDQAIVYGQAMAALEGGSEFIGGSVFGEATDLMDTALGRWIVKSGGDKFFGKGIGKAAYTFASEGFEESIMDIATPLAQSAFDIGDAQDTYFGEDWKKGWGEVISGIPETFVVGGAVGSVIEGFHSSVSALSNKDKGGFKYNKIADEMTIIENALKAQEAVKQSKKATPEIIDAFSAKTSEKVSASVQSISETMQKLPPAQRAEVFADAPMLEMFLNEDGGVSEGFKYFSAKENVDLLSTVKKVESGSFDPKEKVEFGIVDTNTASRIQTITGVDVTGFKVIIEAQQIEHILRDHGKKGRSDQSMSDSSDISKMEYALQNPDDISLGKSTKAYKNTVDGKTQGAKTVLYEKGIGEKSYYVVQAVPDTKAKTLYVVTAFIGQKGYKNGASQLTNETNLGPTSEIEIANTPVDSISQTGTNVNSKISTELMQYAELAGMGENGVQMMQEVYDGKISPEKFFEAYNAIYASGKRGGDVRSRYVALLGENVAAMARNAGEMDALKVGKSATTYKAGERAAKDAKGGSPPASAVQNSSSLTQHDATPAGAAAIPSGDAQEFRGSVTGKTYSAKAAELLSTAEIGALDTNKSYYKLDDLGIPKEEQQAWIDAGLAKERTIRGQAVITVNTTVLKDEVKRREKSSQKVLQNSGGSGTIESTQSRRENSDGKESESRLLSRNTVSDGGGHSKISSEGKGASGDVDSSRVHGESGRIGVLSEDSEGRGINSDTLSKISGTAVADEDGKPISLYHATDKAFDKFAIGDIGFHFGNKTQADTRASAKGIANPRYINAYLNIKNPLRVKSDYMNWHANSVALNLWNEGLISDAEMKEVVSLWPQGKNYDSPAAVKLREILESKGYDGIAYPNGFEGDGMSYIAFHNEQIVRGDNGDASGDQSSDGASPDVQQAKSDQASSSEWSAERIEGGKAEKARPVSEIIEQIRHDFGINITKGHVRGKGVLGQYSKRNHGIRTKIANDLPTVAHELGHALDQRYGLTDKSKLTKEMRSELVTALGDLKGSYKQNLWVSEGFAEYLRRFLQNRDDAARTYPEFTRHFLNSLSKADRVLIDTFADEINAYYALDGDTATSSIRLREEGVPDARTPLEKARDMGDGVYQAWVDANHGIRLFDEATGANTYKLASNAAYSDAIAGQIITGDLTDANGQYVAPGLKAALEGVNIGDKKIYREFGEYLVLRHGPERLNEGMRIFADERKNNAAFMEKRAGELEAAHPEFKEAADRLYTFQKQFLKTWAVDTGLLPSEVAEEWAKRWSFYVPLNRAVGKAGTVGAKRGYANQNSTVRKAIGSGLDIVHPVDNIINNIVKMVNAGVRNNVMLEITAQAKAVGADATFLEEVPAPMKKKTADLTGVKAKLHDAFGAAGIGELLAEVEAESETQARASGQASADIRIDMDDAERYEILKCKSIQPQKIEVDPKFDIDFEYLEKNIKSEIEKPLIKKLRELGYLKRYKTDAIEVDFEFTGGGLRKSLNSQATAYGGSFADLAKVVLNLQKLLDNSVLIEIHSDKGAGTDLENKQLVQTFVMMSAFAEGNSIVPVQFEVKQFVDHANRLYLAVALTKIETGVVGNTTPDKNQASTYLLPVSSISIADLFSKINIKDENFFKYIPDGFLSADQIDAKKRALAKDEAKYGKKSRASSLLATHGLQLPARPSPASSGTSIPQTNENVNKKNSTNSENKKSDAWSKVDEIIESAIDDVLIQYGQGKAHGDVVTVLRNGKQEFWKINDALLLESLTNLSQKKMNGIMEAYAVVSRFMTSNITGNNIIWSIFSNFPRDMMTFFTYSKQKNPLKSFPAMGEAYLNKVTGGNAETKNLPYIKEYYALGGGQTSAYTADVDLAKRARKKLKHSTKLQSAAYYANPLNVLSFLSETVESGPRIATYIMMREKGMSPQDAFYESQDITVNFKRGGRLSREFNKAVPFFNASVQGLDKFKRWITCADVPKAQRAKAIVGRVTMYVAVSAALGALIYALNNGDDEDEENYRLLSNYTKNTYWNIPLGDGKYFAIPKPREIAVLSTFCETTCEYFGGNDYAYGEFGDYVADNFLPPFLSDSVTDGMDGALGSLGIIGVAFHLGANKDFLGRPIESTSLQGYESQDRYTRRTSQIAYWLGQAAAELGLDWSPVQIDYFFSQVLGGYWKVQKALFPVGSENVDWTLGVQNTYVKDNQYSNDIVNWMYDKSTSSAQAAKSHPEDTDIAIEAKLDGDMESFYSRYYALTKGQKEDVSARRAKRVVLDMIVEYRKASDNGDESEAQKVIYDLIDRCHDTSLLPSVMQTKVKDADGKEHSLRDYQYVEYQTTYNALYWGYVEDNLGGMESDAEMIAIIKKAQTIAKERATQKALESVGAGSSGYFEKYPGIDDSDLITFQSQMDIETDKDGGLSQEELIDILERMVADGLSKEDAYTLFKSRFPASDKNNPWRSYAP